MKKSLQGFIIGIISGVIITGSIGVFAAYYTQSLSATAPFVTAYEQSSMPTTLKRRSPQGEPHAGDRKGRPYNALLKTQTVGDGAPTSLCRRGDLYGRPSTTTQRQPYL